MSLKRYKHSSSQDSSEFDSEDESCYSFTSTYSKSELNKLRIKYITQHCCSWNSEAEEIFDKYCKKIKFKNYKYSKIQFDEWQCPCFGLQSHNGKLLSRSKSLKILSIYIATYDDGMEELTLDAEGEGLRYLLKKARNLYRLNVHNSPVQDFKRVLLQQKRLKRLGIDGEDLVEQAMMQNFRTLESLTLRREQKLNEMAVKTSKLKHICIRYEENYSLEIEDIEFYEQIEKFPHLKTLEVQFETQFYSTKEVLATLKPCFESIEREMNILIGYWTELQGRVGIKEIQKCLLPLPKNLTLYINNDFQSSLSNYVRVRGQ